MKSNLYQFSERPTAREAMGCEANESDKHFRFYFVLLKNLQTKIVNEVRKALERFHLYTAKRTVSITLE